MTSRRELYALGEPFGDSCTRVEFGRVVCGGGGGGGAPKETTTISKSEPPAYVQPYAQTLMLQAENTALRPYQNYPGQKIAGLDPYQQAGFDMTAERASSGSPVMNQAQDMALSTLNGDYLDPSSNPWLQSTYDAAAGRMADAYSRGTAATTNAQFNNMGAFGGSAHQEMTAANNLAFGDSLANLGNQIYGGNYQAERSNQMDAASMADQMAQSDYRDASALIGVGDARRSYTQDVLTQGYQDWLDQYNYPLQQLDIMGNAINIASGGAGTNSTTTPNMYQANPYASSIGGALAGYGMANAMGYGQYSPYAAAGGAALGLLGG